MPWFLNPNIYYKLPVYQNTELYLFIFKLTAAAAFAFYLWKQGVSKRQLLAVTYIFFYGVFLTVMLFMHNTVILGLRIFDQPSNNFTYDFHLYSLILLGSILFLQGVRLVRSAFLLKAGDEKGIREALRATMIVLAVAIPMIPIQFFGIELTVLSLLNLAIVKLLLPRSVIWQRDKAEKTSMPISSFSFDR
ncbi:MAG TPA: hypothetical protein VK308_16080 [Pyrinomonadaceae bacterium]|nr:hypothetical protein [Pyrinomonadaceae bacterium]